MCKAYDLNPSTVKARLKGGMPLEEALTKRPRKWSSLKGLYFFLPLWYNIDILKLLGGGLYEFRIT